MIKPLILAILLSLTNYLLAAPVQDNIYDVIVIGGGVSGLSTMAGLVSHGDLLDEKFFALVQENSNYTNNLQTVIAIYNTYKQVIIFSF